MAELLNLSEETSETFNGEDLNETSNPSTAGSLWPDINMAKRKQEEDDDEDFDDEEFDDDDDDFDDEELDEDEDLEDEEDFLEEEPSEEDFYEEDFDFDEDDDDLVDDEDQFLIPGLHSEIFASHKIILNIVGYSGFQ